MGALPINNFQDIMDPIYNCRDIMDGCLILILIFPLIIDHALPFPCIIPRNYQYIDNSRDVMDGASSIIPWDRASIIPTHP